MNKVCIVTSFASYESILKHKDSILVGVEKGIKHIFDLGLIPSFCVSDFDTLDYKEIEEDVKNINILKLPSEKDYSDTEFALIKSIELFNPSEVVILCSLSSRYDHSHSLLLLLKKYINNNVKLVDDLNMIRAFEKGNYYINKEDYSYLGVFGFPSGVITLKEVKYEVSDYKLDFCETKAISNEIINEFANIDVKEGNILLVLSRDK